MESVEHGNDAAEEAERHRVISKMTSVMLQTKNQRNGQESQAAKEAEKLRLAKAAEATRLRIQKENKEWQDLERMIESKRIEINQK